MGKSQENNIFENLIDVRRVTKVVQGGRRFSFSACVVAGNKNGSVAFDHKKANEITDAKEKASRSAKKILSKVKIPLYKGVTIHHDVSAKFGGSRVILRRAKPGTGIIAGGAMRVIFALAGIKDIVAKLHGSSNVYTVMLATLSALNKLSLPREVARKRGISVSELSKIPSEKDNLSTKQENKQEELS